MSGKSSKPLFLATLAVLGIAVFLLTRPIGSDPQAGADPAPGGDGGPGGSATASLGIAATKSAARIEDATGLSTDSPHPGDAAPGIPVIADCKEGCAHCANLEKLTDSQVEYADERLAEILESHSPDPAQTERLRRACLQLAEAVILEWSPEEDAPVLQAEGTIRALKLEIIGPVLAGVPSK